jgi:GntR family transcriptional regulator
MYKQIADWLRTRIDTGAVPVGERLPSESQLVQQFHTARTTVRRALASLAMEGRVETKRGVGVFVRDRTRKDAVVRQPFKRLARHYRASGKSALWVDAESQGRTVRQELFELADVPAPPDIAKRLGLPADAPVLLRRRRMWFGDEPTQLDRSYLPLDLAEGPLRVERPGDGGVHARLEEAGHRLTSFTEDVSVRMPNPDETRQLRLAEGIPVVDLTQIAYSGERPVECFVAVIAGDKYRFRYDIPAK